jgi:light-regulated signal transduction histidine kinase (bacteriophytochrome)
MSYKLSRAEKSRKKHLDELEMAVKDLESFSYSVSHDLRSPLRAIDGFIAILKEDYGKSLDEEGLRLFGIVQENANKMGELIDDILAFSRAGRFELQKAKVNMKQLVTEVWDDIQLENPEAEIQMQIDDIPDINADVIAIRQVLHNLLSNAVKFTRKKEKPKIQVGSEKLEGSIRYFVKDNGAGFNKEYKDKLFVMFQRLHGMDEFEGTGVGLAIVKRFIQKHNGSVDADAIVDKGATFNFILPVEPVSSGKERGND